MSTKIIKDPDCRADQRYDSDSRLASGNLQRRIGALGEEVAITFMERQGFRILERNWSCKMGELDLIMRSDKELVFVEVKSLKQSAAAERYLFSSMTVAKQKKLRRLAEVFIQVRNIKLAPRIDVVGVMFDYSGRQVLKIVHLKAAV